MTTIQISKTLGTDISSRARAAALRNDVVRLVVENGEKAVLDFADVRTISDSFADELFAVLVESKGEVWFRENIEVANLDELTKATILEAIAQRLHAV